MRVVTLSLAPLVMLCAVSFARAQDYYGGADVWGRYGTYDHASTAAEGALRGMADVTRSAGAANLMNSQAAGYWQDAQRRYIENRQYGAETYFNMRAANRAAREAERRYGVRIAPVTVYRGVALWGEFATQRPELERLFGGEAVSGAQ